MWAQISSEREIKVQLLERIRCHSREDYAAVSGGCWRASSTGWRHKLGASRHSGVASPWPSRMRVTRRANGRGWGAWDPDPLISAWKLSRVMSKPARSSDRFEGRLGALTSRSSARCSSRAEIGQTEFPPRSDLIASSAEIRSVISGTAGSCRYRPLCARGRAGERYGFL